MLTWKTFGLRQGLKLGRSLTLTLLAISLVSRLADAVVGLGRILAQGVNVAVVGTLCAFVCICAEIEHQDPSLLSCNVSFISYYGVRLKGFGELNFGL